MRLLVSSTVGQSLEAEVNFVRNRIAKSHMLGSRICVSE
jgi:hypothetical protein